jgi:hypothetical protein
VESGAETNLERPHYLPYGWASRAWEQTVFMGLGLSLPVVWVSVYRDILAGASVPCCAFVAAWLTYAGVQVLNKTPISFRFERRSDMITLAGSLAGIVATISFALDLGAYLPAGAWQAGLGVAGASTVYALFFVRFSDADGRPIGAARELYAKSMSVAVDAPMIAALIVLATRAAA